MICVPCKKIYRPEKNGIYLEEMMPISAGLAIARHWVPYKLWVGDRLKCPGCGHEVIAGIPLNPIAEHYQPDYGEVKTSLQPELQVEDCGPLQLGSRDRTEANGLRTQLRATQDELENVHRKLEELLTNIQRMTGHV